VHYSGDRFFVPTVAGLAMSLDGRSWFVERQPLQAFAVAAPCAKKGSAIAQVQGASNTTAFSFTESSTIFSAPQLSAGVAAVSGGPVIGAPVYIKAL